MHRADQNISLLGVFIWSIAALFFLYEFFLRTFVGSIAHQIIPDLHLTIEQFTFIGSAYYIAYGMMQIPVGILADKFGVKNIMIFATLCCALATFLFAHATSFPTAFIGRFLMGFGSAFAFISLLVIASTWFPHKYFGFFAGMSQFIGTMGPVLAGGPLVSFLNDSHVSWRLAMSEVAIFGVVLAVLAFLFIKNKPRGGEQSLMYLTREEGLMIRLKRLLKNKQAWVVASYSGTVYVAIAVMAAVWGTEYLQTRGLTQSTAAYMISLSWIAYAIGCPLLGVISDITKRRKPAMLIAAILGVISTLCIVYIDIQQTWIYGVLFALLGLAAAGQNVGFAAIAEHTSFSVKATALGLNNGFITLSTAILPIIIGLFISHASHGHATSALVSSDFTLGLSFLPLMYVLATLICLFGFRETYCKPQKNIIILKTSNQA
tara:strand:- start:158834 stop:160132 length:1299 start_codon:yes stop_codon:yes gene_type:complete